MPLNQPSLKNYAVLCRDGIKKAGSFIAKTTIQLRYEIDATFLDIYKLEYLFEKYQKNIEQLKGDAEKIANERIKLEKSLLLCQRCWQFIEDIKHYPLWYKNVKNDDGTPYWKSKTIKPNELVLRKFSSSTHKKLIDDSEDFSSGDEIIEFSFKLEGNEYCLYVNMELRYRDKSSYSSKKGKLMYYYPVFVFENKDHLVFKSKLYYDDIEHGNNFGYYNLEVFEPGPWVKILLHKILEVRKEEKHYSKKVNQ
jgi:hypothetical protein